MQGQQEFMFAQLYRQVAIIINSRTVHPKVFSNESNSIVMERATVSAVNSIKPLVLDSSRSCDTARVGLPTTK